MIRITTLCENHVPISRGLAAEHGLAFLVEAGREAILFDTGQGLVLRRNASVLEKALERVGRVVLSHGHYDHTGGLSELAQVNSAFTVIAHPSVLDRKIARDDGRPDRDIGMPLASDFFEGHRIPLVLGKEPVRIAEGIFTSGEVPCVTDFEEVDPGLYAQREGIVARDDVPDDLSIIIDTPRGLVVLLGCAHRGIINHLHRARALAGKERIRAVLGGAHLAGSSARRIRRTVEELRRLNVGKMVLGHCTGFAALSALREAFGAGRVALSSAGDVFRC